MPSFWRIVASIESMALHSAASRTGSSSRCVVHIPVILSTQRLTTELARWRSSSSASDADRSATSRRASSRHIRANTSTRCDSAAASSVDARAANSARVSASRRCIASAMALRWPLVIRPSRNARSNESVSVSVSVDDPPPGSSEFGSSPEPDPSEPSPGPSGPCPAKPSSASTFAPPSTFAASRSERLPGPLSIDLGGSPRPSSASCCDRRTHWISNASSQPRTCDADATRARSSSLSTSSGSAPTNESSTARTSIGPTGTPGPDLEDPGGAVAVSCMLSPPIE